MRYITIVFAIFILSGCGIKEPIYSKSTTVIFKTPTMKFYDKGFVTKYDDHIDLEIYNIGQLVLDLKIYEKKVCLSTFKCMDSKTFNEKYLHSSYGDDFLYELFNKDKIYHKDKINSIFIKVK